MIEAVKRSLRHPAIRSLALTVLTRGNVPQREPRRQVDAFYQWVIDNIRFIKDPLGVELIQRPEVSVKLKAGDCDDHSVLIAALSMAVGLPVRFKVIGETPEDFQHVYAEINVDGEWLPVDTTARRGVGYAPAGLKAEKTYRILGVDSMPQTLNPFAVRPKRVPRSAMARAVRSNVTKTLHENWSNGLIDYADLLSYRRVIDEGNAPFTGVEWLESPIKQAIADFAAMIAKTGRPSLKPAGDLSGLEGLDGFLKSIWNGVKSVVGGAVKLVTGGGAQTVRIETAPAPAGSTAPAVSIRTPVTQYTSPTPIDYAREYGSAAGDLFKSPVFLVGVGALVLFLVLGKRK
jgi:hypothetical protein